MTEFTETLRHYCRNPRCRMRLPNPVGNEREAFCTKGCYRGFYRHRCLVCEQPIERKNENQLVCGKRKCRNALQGGLNFGRYHASSSVMHPLGKSIKSGVKTAPGGGRRWRIVAGHLSPEQLHAATVPDGPDCQWKGGEYDRLEARNRRLLEEHFTRLDGCATDHCADCGRDDDLVDHPLGDDRSVTLCRDCRFSRLQQLKRQHAAVLSLRAEP
jgi:hypothetical protein